MSEQRKKQIEEVMKNAEASLAVEGLKVTDEGRELVRQKLLGNLTEEEFLNRAAELAKKE